MAESLIFEVTTIRLKNFTATVKEIAVANTRLVQVAYNHGLTHAGLLFNGVDVETIKEMQNRMRNSVR